MFRPQASVHPKVCYRKDHNVSDVTYRVIRGNMYKPDPCMHAHHDQRSPRARARGVLRCCGGVVCMEGGRRGRESRMLIAAFCCGSMVDQGRGTKRGPGAWPLVATSR